MKSHIALSTSTAHQLFALYLENALRSELSSREKQIPLFSNLALRYFLSIVQNYGEDILTETNDPILLLTKLNRYLETEQENTDFIEWCKKNNYTNDNLKRIYTYATTPKHVSTEGASTEHNEQEEHGITEIARLLENLIELPQL